MRNATYEASLVKRYHSIGWEEKFTKAIIEGIVFGYKKNYLGQMEGRELQVYMALKKEACTVGQNRVIKNGYFLNFYSK